MLTIQPNVTNVYNRMPAFGRSEISRYPKDSMFMEDVSYEEVTDSCDDGCEEYVETDISSGIGETKRELDLWKQTKANVDAIAKTTENVPGVKTGTKILSGLTAVAIGWGGLRWGTVGTLEVLSKLSKSDAVRIVKGFAENSGRWISKRAGSLKKYAQGTDIYKSVANRISGWGESFADSSVGKMLGGWKDAVTESSVYEAVVKAKTAMVAPLKNANYKRIFIESMGIAGGVNAAVNVLGGKTIDGRTQNVEVNKDGKYFVNDKEYILEGDVSDAA